MAPTTAPRLTKERDGSRRSLGMEAGTKINQGAIVAVNADGFAVPMSTATTLRGIGRASDTVDNTGGADGDLSIEIDVGIFAFDNSSAGDLIARGDIGKDCYGVDDQTVALTHATNTRSVAGKIFDVDADGVWVDFR